jgi:hypothetical protein
MPTVRSLSLNDNKQVDDLHGQLVQVSAGHSCYRQLTWECIFEPPAAVTTLIEQLLHRGFVDESHSPLVRELLHPEQHRLIIIPTTGRVQLRLHYLTPKTQRETVAHSFAALLTQLTKD